MKIIGIIGKSGAGKTTFTEMLEQNNSVGIIKIDDFVADSKKKYFRLFLQPKENNTTEVTQKSPKIKSAIKKFFFKDKFRFNILMKLRSRMVKSRVERSLNEYRKQGKELVVIDDWMLLTHKWLTNRLYKTYRIERSFISRRLGLKERSDLKIEEMKIDDLPYALKFFKDPDSVIPIKNNGTKADLKQKATEICKSVITPSFDEKYKVKIDESMIKQENKHILEKNNRERTK